MLKKIVLFLVAVLAFSGTAFPYSEQLSQIANYSGFTNGPRAMEIDQNGNLYVVDGKDIVVLDNNLQFIKRFTPLTDLKLNESITDIAVASSGNIYITQYAGDKTNRHRLIKFNSNFSVVAQYGGYGAGSDNQHFDVPNGVDIDNNENVYVADLFNSRIMKFNSSLQYLGQGKCDYGCSSISISNNRVYTTSDSRAHTFDLSLNSLRDQFISQNGTFQIRADTQGNAFVIGNANNNQPYQNIFKLDSNLQKLWLFEGVSQNINDLGIDATGKLFVLGWNNVLVKYQIVIDPSPSIDFDHVTVEPENRYIHAGEDFELTIRVSYINAILPFQGLLSTDNPDFQILRAAGTFEQEGSLRYASNVASKFLVKYVGVKPLLLGDFDFNLHIDSPSTDLAIPVNFGILSVPGWPIDVEGRIVQMPTLADLDPVFPGLEVVFGASAKMHAWHNDGTQVSGWPQLVSSWVYVSPAVADLVPAVEGLEVIVGASGGEVYAWHRDGTLAAGWPQWTGGSIYSSPAIADLDPNYPGLEVVIGINDGKVYAWHSDGTLVAGWPQIIGGAVYTTPAIGHLEPGGEELNIVVGSSNGKVYIWRPNGTLIPGAPIVTSATSFSTASIADIDPDYPGNEIVIGTNEQAAGGTGYNVYVWHYDGTLVNGWPRPSTGIVSSALSVGDIDLQYEGLEIVSGGNIAFGNRVVEAWHKDGMPLLGWPKILSRDYLGSPALANIDPGVPGLEIVVGSTDKNVYAWHYDGSDVYGFPIRTENEFWTSQSIADFNNDGKLEIIAAADANGRSRIYAWALPSNALDNPVPWPMFQHDPQRTGFYTLPNRLPVFAINPSSLPIEGSEGQAITFQVVNVSDPDGDSVTVSVDETTLPQAASFDSNTLTFAWTPSFDQAGDYSVTVKAGDGKDIATKVVLINVQDSVPPVTDEGIFLSVKISDVWNQYDFDGGVIQADPTESYLLRNCPGPDCSLLLNKETYICDGAAAGNDPSGRAGLLHARAPCNIPFPPVISEGDNLLTINISDVWDQCNYQDVIGADPTESYTLIDCPGPDCRLALNRETYVCDGSAAEADSCGRAMALHQRMC
jgi:hypothetical protein